MFQSTIHKVNIHPAVYMMEQWQLFMDGIDRIVGFYYSEQTASMEGLDWSNKIGQSQIIPFSISDDVLAEMKHVCEEKHDFQWLRPDLLPFTNRSSVMQSQLDLFSEHQYLVLLIRLHDSISNCADLFYLFFRNDQSNFGITDTQTKLDTSHKAIIGKMATRFGKMTIHNFKAAKKKELEFKTRTKALLEARLAQNEQLKTTFSNWKKHWLVNYISQLSQRDGVNYVICDKAEKLLLSNQFPFDTIIETLEKAIVYICELSDFSMGDEIFLDESILIIEEPLETKELPEVNQPSSRINKTMHLLDRLENAAEILLNKGLPITSADVGLNMDKPVTAPAITDALRKNRTRIFQLFEQYPQRWQVIKHHFKPIINLTTKKNQYLSISS